MIEGKFSLNDAKRIAGVVSRDAATGRNTLGARVRYPENTGPFGSPLPLIITGTVTMGGVYTVKPLTAPVGDLNHTGSTFTASTLGGTSAATNGYFYNLPEMGQTTHDLSSTTNSATVVLGLRWSVNADSTINFLGTGVFPGCS